MMVMPLGIAAERYFAFCTLKQNRKPLHAAAGLPADATCIADVGRSAKSMARGGQGLPRERGGDPLDLLDAGTSRKLVKHAAAARGVAAAGPAHEEEDEFEHADDGKMIIRVCLLPCSKKLYRPHMVHCVLLDSACVSRASVCWHDCTSGAAHSASKLSATLRTLLFCVASPPPLQLWK